MRAAQAAAAKALSGSQHGSGGSLARTSSSTSLTGRQPRQQRDAPGAMATLPPAASSAPAVRPQPVVADHSSAAEPSADRDTAEGSRAGVAPGSAAVAEASGSVRAEVAATHAESKAGTAGASEEPEAPATPSPRSREGAFSSAQLCPDGRLCQERSNTMLWNQSPYRPKSTNSLPEVPPVNRVWYQYGW